MCEHRRLKKNYPFGKNSSPRMVCKDCGEIVTAHDKVLQKRQRKQRSRRRR